MAETILTYIYIEEEDGYQVSGYTSIQDNGIVAIPNTYNGLNGEKMVTSIGSYAFSGCELLNKVIISNGVISINKNAFSGCSHLTSVILPDHMDTIDEYAFSGCSSIKNISIPKGIKSIEQYTFSDCMNLCEILLPLGLVNIGDYAFQGCQALKHINLPNSLSTLGQSAFYGCVSLLNIEIPNGVKVLHYGLFEGCTTLSRVIIPNSVITIKAFAFIGCTSLNSIVLPDSLQKIEAQVFSGCSNLQFIKIGNGITRFGFENSDPTNIFYGCDNLTDAFYYGSKETWNFYKENFKDIHFNRLNVRRPIKDFDFTAFTFDGNHSLLDLNIIRTSEGDRYNSNLSPQAKDILTEVPGGNGQYYFGTNHQSQQFSISFAFDALTDTQFHKLKQVFSGDKISDLIFDEEPYKVYSAKVTGVPTLKYLPFDGPNGERIYKGEGTIQFTAYWPYAHTPNIDTKISKKFRKTGTFEKNGLLFDEYDEWLYPMKDQWRLSSKLYKTNNVNVGENHGDISAPFIVTYNSIIEDLKITIGTQHIIIRAKDYVQDDPTKPGPKFTDLKWDSKTGMVSAKINNAVNEVPISYEGNSCGELPISGTNTVKVEKWNSETEEWVNYLKVDSDGTWKQYVEDSWVAVPTINNILTLKYNYWYY